MYVIEDLQKNMFYFFASLTPPGVCRYNGMIKKISSVTNNNSTTTTTIIIIITTPLTAYKFPSLGKEKRQKFNEKMK